MSQTSKTEQPKTTQLMNEKNGPFVALKQDTKGSWVTSNGKRVSSHKVTGLPKKPRKAARKKIRTKPQPTK